MSNPIGLRNAFDANVGVDPESPKVLTCLKLSAMACTAASRKPRCLDSVQAWAPQMLAQHVHCAQTTGGYNSFVMAEGNRKSLV